MADNYRAIVIDVQDKSVPNGVGEQWADITTHMPIFTRDIKTPSLDSNSDLTSVVSGMPTVFARANLFKLAIDYIQEPDKRGSQSDGLMNFYRNLVDEWRGFIACLALDYTRIEVRRIDLAYSDGKDISETSNIYEPKGAFGNVLFERKSLWMKQGVAANSDAVPFIYVILYDGSVVGAVSPDSLLFTSPSYELEPNHPFANIQTKKFTDPLKSALNEEQALTLYAYVEHVELHIQKLEEYYKAVIPSGYYSTVQGNIRNWKEEIEKYCIDRHFDVNSKSVPSVDKFQEPYDLVFNYSSKLYGFEGMIFDHEDKNSPENKIYFDPKKILLPKDSEIARIHLGTGNNTVALEDQPVYVLKAKVEGKDEYAYFALPITPLGLNVFGKNIGALTGIDTNNAIQSKLSAEYNEQAVVNNLLVNLSIKTVSGQYYPISESYTVKKERIIGKDILLWPNFISEKWNRYFLYSEMPHNAVSQNCPFRATPIVGSNKDNDFRIIVDDKTKEPVILAENGKIVVSEEIQKQTGLSAKFHIVSDNRVSDNDYKYEIYESNLPFKGVKLTSGNKESGYLVIRYTTAQKKFLPKNEYGLGRNLLDANVGIDFGSTNTSVAYSINQNDPKGITFKNHRISLLQSGNDRFSKERDLFFFQSKEIEGNSIKSILTLNAQRRFVETDPMASSKEISGGMPCFDPSLLPVETVTENRILLNLPQIGQAQLVHNMKWTTEDCDIANKKAFLRTLMLHIYAQLYTEGCVPTNLKWSYPSSMGDRLVNQYGLIWQGLSKDLSPVIGKELTISKSDIAITLQSGGGWKNVNNLSSGGWKTQGWKTQQSPEQNTLGGWDFAQQQSAQPTTNGWLNEQQSAQPTTNAWPNEQQPAQPTTNGWATQPVNDGGFSMAPNIEDLEPDSNQIHFEFENVDPSKCMTEACAVANFIMTKNIPTQMGRTLTLCFDVGGSTTDISALLITPDQKLSMIKQNSIKFAAQRISTAAKYDPDLKQVLKDLCIQLKMKIPGLSTPVDKYTEETASFYFEQVLDRMKAEDLPMLYSAISAKCPRLMSINLYVTGLIVYYAGQLTNKLINVVRTSFAQHPMFANFTPNVNVMFAGKGARIFEWFSTTQHNAAQQYYSSMFIQGIGGMQKAQEFLAGPPLINLSRGVSNDVKYEVSKGLALGAKRSINVPKNNMEAIEILGEDNFFITKASTFEEIPLQFDNAITSKMMEQIGQFFQQKQPQQPPFACTKFADFAYMFYQTAVSLFGLPLSQDDFIRGFMDMNIENYILNLPEYRNAQNNKNGNEKFDFVAPIIILEGMKFYDEFLLKNLGSKA